MATAGSFATISPFWIALALGFFLAAVWAGMRLGGVNLSRRYYETWGCGRALQTAQFEYSASAFSNPFRRVFAFLYRPDEQTTIEAHPESRLFVKATAYHSQSRSIVEESIYAPIGAAIRRAAMKVRGLQSGNVHSYLLYILLALLVLLLFAR